MTDVGVNFSSHAITVLTKSNPMLLTSGATCVITAFDMRFMTHLLRVCCPFMYCRCLTLLTRRKCTGPWVTFGQYCSSAGTFHQFYSLNYYIRLYVTRRHEMSHFAHLRKVRKREKGKYFLVISIHDVFCQNRLIAVPRYDNCTPNML
jgi:hypothetical protein